MIQQELFSETKARDRKERGIKEVLKNESEFWKPQALLIIETLARRFEQFTSDDFRLAMEKLGLNPPTHPNSIGALFSAAAKAQIIRKTGTYKPSEIPSSHGRILSIWKKY